MARHPPELPGDQVRLPVVVVDPVDHGVLKGDAAAGLVEVVVAGPEQLLHVIGPVDGHDLGSGLAVRRMEGHRESQLKFKLRQPPDARHDAAGGEGDMPHPDVHAVGVVHQLQEFQHRVQVVQRLADTHQHDVGDGQAGVFLGEQHLVQHLRRGQVPDLAGDGGGTEGAPHSAPHLGGDAHGVAVVVLHEHCLDAVAVGQLPEVFDGPVQPGHLLAGHLGGGDETGLLQLFPQGLGEIGHPIEVRHPPVEPGEHLPAPEGRLPQGLEEGRHLRQGQ